jgi:hypothetical protein
VHRPHRSIEVFDISLMAVVTKAMGAFLVIMLLLMPYYSSGSLGDKAAAEAAQQLKEAQQKLQALAQQLSGRSPDEIAKMLQDALDRLAKAETAIAQLKRDNDALNAQARRLDSQNAELRDELARADAERKKVRLSGLLINSDCADVRLEFGVMAKSEYFETADKRHLTNLLNHVLTLGTNVTSTADEAVASNPSQAAVPRGHGMRFDHSIFQYDAPPGDYYLVVASTAKPVTKIDDLDSHVLKHVPTACHALLNFTYAVPTKNILSSFWIREIALSQDDYAVMPAELTVGEDKVSWFNPSAEALAWLRDQIAHAEKEETPSKTLVQ